MQPTSASPDSGSTESHATGSDTSQPSSNPDPTMKKPAGNPKGENMPPRGGEEIAPRGDTRSPKDTQEQMKRDSGA